MAAYGSGHSVGMNVTACRCAWTACAGDPAPICARPSWYHDVGVGAIDAHRGLEGRDGVVEPLLLHRDDAKPVVGLLKVRIDLRELAVLAHRHDLPVDRLRLVELAAKLEDRRLAEERRDVVRLDGEHLVVLADRVLVPADSNVGGSQVEAQDDLVGVLANRRLRFGQLAFREGGPRVPVLVEHVADHQERRDHHDHEGHEPDEASEGCARHGDGRWALRCSFVFHA